jgi:ribosomal protein S18 acetylase RimI-like enzyme
MSYSIRIAAAQDVAPLFRLVNQPYVLAGKIKTKKKIEYEEHVSWFATVLSSNKHFLWVICDDDLLVGQIRCSRDSSDTFWLLDIAVLKKYQGLGLAPMLLKHAMKALAPGRFIAMVKPKNIRSQNFFMNQGFKFILPEKTQTEISRGDNTAFIYEYIYEE